MMLSIQDVGTEILEKNPRKFYVMLGDEYGVKMKYVDIISEAYGTDPVESPTVQSVLSMMSTKHLIPLPKRVYIVRYDETFLSELDDKTESKISSTNIIGTIVCIYESEKSSNKVAKYLPNYSVSVDKISKKFMISYLHKDFPKLPDKLIDASAEISSDYNQAKNVCTCMMNADIEELYKLDYDELYSLFGVTFSANDAKLRSCIAARSFKACVDVYHSYEGTSDEFLYSILSTMIELEKIISNKFIESPIRDFKNNWNLKDVYNMFMNTYDMMLKSRLYSSLSDEGIIYLLSLLQFSEIPSLEYMQS